MKSGTYSPAGDSKGAFSLKKIHRSALKSAGRAEIYYPNIFKSRSVKSSSLLSLEMESIAHTKTSVMMSESFLWRDKMQSVLATPLGAEMYLQCERGASSIMFNAPRYYNNELNVVNLTSEGDPVPPNARSRYPYSSDSHEAGKKIASRLARNLARRHHAASVIQRSYKTFVSLRNFRKEVISAGIAARKLQFFWRKRLARIRKARSKTIVLNRNAIKIQCLVRIVLAKARVKFVKRRMQNRAAKKITRFVRFACKERKHKRGRAKRRQASAIKIQAFVRGCMSRKHRFGKKAAVRLIWKCWKRYWYKKYGKHGVKIFHFIRRVCIRKLVVRIQKLIRGFIGRRAAKSKKAKMIAKERGRITTEFTLVERALTRSAQKKDYSWASETVYDGSTVHEIMLQLDTAAKYLLSTSVLDVAVFAHAAVPSFPISAFSYKQRVTLAVLSVFSNRPGACIDGTSLKLALAYLSPCHRAAPLPPVSSRERCDDAFSSSSAIPSLQEMLPLSMPELLAKYFVFDVTALSFLLEPSISLRLRIAMTGRLPDKLLAEAVLARRWGIHTDMLCKEAIWKHRTRGNSPDLVCHRCWQPFLNASMLVAHMEANSLEQDRPTSSVPLPSYQGCSNRTNCASWLRKEAFVATSAALLNRVKLLRAHPTIAGKEKANEKTVSEALCKAAQRANFKDAACPAPYLENLFPSTEELEHVFSQKVRVEIEALANAQAPNEKEKEQKKPLVMEEPKPKNIVSVPLSVIDPRRPKQPPPGKK